MDDNLDIVFYIVTLLFWIDSGTDIEPLIGKIKKGISVNFNSSVGDSSNGKFTRI